MIRIKGRGCAKGEAVGRLKFYRRENKSIEIESRLSPDEEAQRFRDARDKAQSSLLMLSEKCRRDVGEEAAMLFETHAMLAADRDFHDSVTDLLFRLGCTAEYAVRETGEKFAAVMENADDEYLRERSRDIRDVSDRIIGNLSGMTDDKTTALSDEPVIIAADDLAPSETVQLDRKKVLGFILKEGSPGGHTAILARTMGIPAICSSGDALSEKHEGMTACMDGTSGEIIVNPDESTVSAWKKRIEGRTERELLLKSMKGREDITPDGVRISIHCNISSAADLEAVLDNDGRGIGLFRSEFIYLASSDFPDEESQFLAYRKVIESMEGKRVVIRTLDIGADKQAEYFGMKKEENPAMGMRAVRFCLTHPEVFRTQLRAICRASAYGKAAVLFPMITSVREVEECMRLFREVTDELKKENISYDPFMEIGIMIETPASVLIADELAGMVDFFSVGTNDLTQYTLACDRQNGGMEKFCDPHHPAVIRSLKMASEAAHRHGIWIGICGDLAAEPEMLPFFLSIGIDELSVPPSCVLPMRAAVRSFGIDEIKPS